MRTLGGVKDFLTQYGTNRIVDAKADHSSGVELQHLEEYLYNIFQYGSQEKVAFLGNRAILTINQICRKNSQYQIFANEKEFGMNVTRLSTPFGDLVMKRHPLFNQVTGGTNTTAYYGMESWMYVLDMANLQYVYLKDSDTKYEPKYESNGVDGMHSGYLSEVSLELHHANTHYLIKNLVAAKADS
jgi:hypothetical protein